MPVNSYELELHLTDVGLSLLAFAKEYNFSEKCTGVKDCDFIQCVIIEFISEIKIDFIAYHAVHVARSKGIHQANIVANEHDISAVTEAAIHAEQAGIISRDFNRNAASKIRYAFDEAKKALIYEFHQWKIKRIRRTMVGDVKPPVLGQFKVLMSTFHPGTVSTLTPIQDRLKDQFDVHQLYLANRHETYFKLIKMGYSNIINAWNINGAKNYYIDKSVLRAFVKGFFGVRFPYGQSTPHFIEKFYTSLYRRLEFAVSLYGPIKYILGEYKPDTLLISSCSTTDAQIMIHCAKNQNINTIEMTHGMFQDTPMLKFQHVPVKLVWCQRQHDVMMKYASSIECPVIGNPKHDELKEKFRLSPPKNPFAKPFVLFASTPGNNISISWSTYVEIFRNCILVSQRFEELIFVWKLHPSENLNKIVDLAKELGAKNNFIVEKERDIYPLLFTAEIVIVLTSTVGFEALLWDKKMITYTIPNSDKWLPFAQYGLVKSASDCNTLIECVRYFLDNRSLTLQNPNKDYFIFSDGKAIERILSYILKIK